MIIEERSHIGKSRTSNQDFVQFFTNQNQRLLALVCDGMGGHSAGDVASKMAAVHFGNAWETSGIEEYRLQEWTAEQLKTENQRILEKSQKYSGLEGMGTTIVGALEKHDSWLVFNVGDSRAYHFSNNRLTQVTSDHSFVNELVKRGEISQEEAVHHPKKNVLTRSLGVDSTAEADFFEIERNTGDIVMICSDGLTNMVNDQQIEAILNEKTGLGQKADKLLEEALEAGGSDNISFILLKQTEEGGKENGIRGTY